MVWDPWLAANIAGQCALSNAALGMHKFQKSLCSQPITFDSIYTPPYQTVLEVKLREEPASLHLKCYQTI